MDFVGTKTSRYGPYELGYRRAIKTFTKWSKNFKEVELIMKKSNNFLLDGLLSEIRQHERGISSNRWSLRNGEDTIRDELTVCRWEGIWIERNCY